MRDKVHGKWGFKRGAVAALFGATVLMGSGPAFADLVLAPNIQVQGSGLGAVNTLVTASNTGRANLTQSGCVSSTGGATFDFSCLDGLQGGDNQAINRTRLLSTVSATDASDLALVVNIAETGDDLRATLTDLYLSLYGTDGGLLGTFSYTGPDLELTQRTGTGIGGSGFVFVLDAAQQLQADAACPILSMCYVGGGFQFGAGTTNNGPETLYIVSVLNGGVPAQVVPEPASMALVGLAVLGAGFARRKHKG